MIEYRSCEGVVTAYAEQVNILTGIFGLACFNTRDSCRVFAVHGVFLFCLDFGMATYRIFYYKGALKNV